MQASPPTTADCEKAYKVACYQPAQIQQAYDLPPLYVRAEEFVIRHHLGEVISQSFSTTEQAGPATTWPPGSARWTPGPSSVSLRPRSATKGHFVPNGPWCEPW